MIPKLLLSHGSLASEFLAAVERIVENLEGFEALSVEWTAGLDVVEDALRVCLEDLDQGQGVLILTDLHGATPYNAACAVAEQGRYEVVSGMNLAMVVRLACSPPTDLSVTDLAAFAVTKGLLGIGRPELKAKK